MNNTEHLDGYNEIYQLREYAKKLEKQNEEYREKIELLNDAILYKTSIIYELEKNIEGLEERIEYLEIFA